MNLFINTTAVDKSLACATSLTNLTPIVQPQDLTLGDTEPLSITFTDGAGGPSWAGNASYTPTFCLGTADADGLQDMCTAYGWTAFTGASGGGWTGYIALNTQTLVDAIKLQVGSAVDWSRFPYQNRQPGPRPKYGWFDIQIGVTDASGRFTSYADFRVVVRNRVLLPGTVAQVGNASVVKAAQVSAGNSGATTSGVTFAAAYPTACTAVVPTLIPPTGQPPVLVAIAPGTTPSASGFQVIYGAPLPAAGYVLSYIAFGY